MSVFALSFYPPNRDSLNLSSPLLFATGAQTDCFQSAVGDNPCPVIYIDQRANSSHRAFYFHRINHIFIISDLCPSTTPPTPPPVATQLKHIIFTAITNYLNGKLQRPVRDKIKRSYCCCKFVSWDHPQIKEEKCQIRRCAQILSKFNCPHKVLDLIAEAADFNWTFLGGGNF